VEKAKRMERLGIETAFEVLAQVIAYSILACVNEGEEIIYPNPGFLICESFINFVGAKSIPLPLLEEKEFSFDPKQLETKITNKTKMIIINFPIILQEVF